MPTITGDQLRERYNMPLRAVAEEFGVCLTYIKKVCRHNGIYEWPYRKIKKMNSLTQHSDIQKMKPVKSRVNVRPANKPTRHMNHAGFDLELDLGLKLDNATSMDYGARHRFTQNPVGAPVQHQPPTASPKSLELFAALQQEFWESAHQYTQQATEIEQNYNPAWRVQRQYREATMAQSLQMQERLLTRLLHFAQQQSSVPGLPTSLANLATQLTTEQQVGPSMVETHPEVASELESLRMMVNQGQQRDMDEHSSGSDSDAPSTDTLEEEPRAAAPQRGALPQQLSREATSEPRQATLGVEDMDLDLANFFGDDLAAVP